MTSFPSPLQITLPAYPGPVELRIVISPQGLIATVDLELLPAGTFIPKPIDFGNNFDNGTITFAAVTVQKGDTLLATTRVTSLLQTAQQVSLDHAINNGTPHTLSATIATGAAEKYYAEFLFS